MKQRNIRLISNLLLLLTAFIWGVAFVAQSVGMDYVGPWTFVCFRYILSALILIPVSWYSGKRQKEPARRNPGNPQSRKSDAPQSRTPGNPQSRKSGVPQYLKGGICCGIFLGLASIAQQAGIQYTTTGKAGFITALYVVLVPLIGILFRIRPEKKIWICVILGLAGLYLISVKEGFRIESGDALVMLCALLFACQILCVDHFSSKLENLVLLSNLQFAVAAVIGAIGMLIFETPRADHILAAALPILYAGLLSGAVGYTLQVIGQKHTDPSVASLIMSLESVFSAIAGWVILGHALSGRELLGCLLVMAAVLLAQIPAEKLLVLLIRKKRE
ncbi:MAG: DMT family transporter [Parasporobacterium sp.]|nr:DMT family transporter [Parasporobacterium sp.]